LQRGKKIYDAYSANNLANLKKHGSSKIIGFGRLPDENNIKFKRQKALITRLPRNKDSL
jgi:hypothetical protein